MLVGVIAMLSVDAGSSALDVAWRLALVGVGNGLFAGPNSTEILARTPAELIGTSSGVTSLLRTLGFSFGPAIGALAWATMSGGTGGLIVGVSW